MRPTIYASKRRISFVYSFCAENLRSKILVSNNFPEKIHGSQNSGFRFYVKCRPQSSVDSRSVLRLYLNKKNAPFDMILKDTEQGFIFYFMGRETTGKLVSI